MPRVNPVVPSSGEILAYIPGPSGPAGMPAKASAGVARGETGGASNKQFSTADHPTHLERDEESVACDQALLLWVPRFISVFSPFPAR